MMQAALPINLMFVFMWCLAVRPELGVELFLLLAQRLVGTVSSFIKAFSLL